VHIDEVLVFTFCCVKTLNIPSLVVLRHEDTDTMASNMAQDTIRANWRCFLACGLMLATPFQYGLDFGLIGGLQAMRGFLMVRYNTFVDNGSP
jgi:hypothetical protein